MTVRVKPVTRPKRRSLHGEERQQLVVTIGFIAVVAVSLLLLGAAAALGYYNEHFRAVASVEGTEISRDRWSDRAEIERFRLQRTESRLRSALSAGEIDEESFQERLSLVQQQESLVGSGSLENLIDLTFQAKLAGAQGVSVTPEEVDAAQRRETSSPERRRVLAVVIAPEAATEDGISSETQRLEARDRASKALEQIRAGTPFEDIVREYSTDEVSRERGGDLGLLSDINPVEQAFQEAISQLELNGTTDVVRGNDGVYRIGRVTEIVPGQEDASYLADLQRQVSADAYRRNLEAETLAQKLRQKVVADALAKDHEQVHLSELVVLADPEVPQSVEGEPGDQIRVSHILYTPGDDPTASAGVPETDPAWEQARTDAEAAATDLRGIADVTQRTERFAAVATEESKDTQSGANGGDLGYAFRGGYVKPFADAIWDGQHARGDIIGPVKSEFGYHVILYGTRRQSQQAAVAAVEAALKAPNADFAAIARQYSDGAQAPVGGEVGWFIREQLDPELAETVFALAPGGTTGPQAPSEEVRFFHVSEKAQRPLDVDQRGAVRQGAFEAWYDPQKEQAEAEDRITRDENAAGDTPGESPVAPGDFAPEDIAPEGFPEGGEGGAPAP